YLLTNLGDTMALKSTIYKVTLQLSDFDRDHYQSYSLNVALHPSETIERMLLRLLAFSLYADEALSFTKGLSTDDEPDIWLKSLSDEIELWIDLGLPDLKRIRKASGRSDKVVVLAYGGQKVAPWFDGLAKDLKRIANLSVLRAEMADIEPLLAHVERTMELVVMIQDGSLNVSLGESVVDLNIERLLGEE
ncbi:YaeQ family protein, partial [Oleiphilus sp. HI0117]|uniref:YaeQ family protein n=4 Tax=Oleiphilus TaxID=141450 RepID=UPI000A5670B1